MLTIRPVRPADHETLWPILEPTLRSGEFYTQSRDITREDALAYWLQPAHEVFVAESNDEILGTYYLRANQQGGGSHVANCGYMTASASQGKGIARAMCEHSLDRARQRGFLAMQFNFVVSTNQRAVRLWQNFGFQIVGTLPAAFLHPQAGYVDAFVMFRAL